MENQTLTEQQILTEIRQSYMVKEAKMYNDVQRMKEKIINLEKTIEQIIKTINLNKV